MPFLVLFAQLPVYKLKNQSVRHERFRYPTGFIAASRTTRKAGRYLPSQHRFHRGAGPMTFHDLPFGSTIRVVQGATFLLQVSRVPVLSGAPGQKAHGAAEEFAGGHDYPTFQLASVRSCPAVGFSYIGIGGISGGAGIQTK